MMDKNPLISVITVTFNAENVIEKTLLSVAEQTFNDYEHLIIDGASKDKTLDIIQNGKQNGKLQIISEPDSGLYYAMNKGLHLAKGKYIIFLNAGDLFYDSETLSKYAKACELNYKIIYGETVIVNDSYDFIGPRHLSVPSILTFKSFSKGMLICHQAFMVQKSIAPNFDTSYRFSADYDWTVKCIQATIPAECYNLNCITIKYLSDGLTDKNRIKSLKERFRIMNRHYGYIPTFFNHLYFLFRFLRNK